MKPSRISDLFWKERKRGQSQHCDNVKTQTFKTSAGLGANARFLKEEKACLGHRETMFWVGSFDQVSGGPRLGTFVDGKMGPRA